MRILQKAKEGRTALVDDRFPNEFDRTNANPIVDESNISIPIDDEDSCSESSKVNVSEAYLSNNEDNDSVMDEFEVETPIDSEIPEIRDSDSNLTPDIRDMSSSDTRAPTKDESVTTQSTDGKSEREIPTANESPDVGSRDINSGTDNSEIHTPALHRRGVGNRNNRGKKERASQADPHARKEIEDAGMKHAHRHEEKNGCTVEDVSAKNLGYDLRSKTPGGGIRYIEVKARDGRGSVVLTSNEWSKAEVLNDDYFLYVVLNAATHPQLYIIRNPANAIRAVAQVEVRYQVPLSEIREHGVLVT